ncbi:unnamed protein product, partial [marine sediment metagenome]
ALGKDVETAGQVEITLPFTSADNGLYTPCANQVDDGVTWKVSSVNIQPNRNYMRVYKTQDLGEWAGTETGVYIYISGFFEIA